MGLDALLGMAVYVVTVLLGLVILLCIYFVIVLISHQKSPLWFLKNVKDVQLLAFLLPVQPRSCPYPLKPLRKFESSAFHTQLIIPLGATINMDGTALYKAPLQFF